MYPEQIEYLKTILNLIDRLQKEVEEKTTIIMAGAEKVKKLEQENKELLNKTINYISIKEGTDFEETLKRFKGE